VAGKGHFSLEAVVEAKELDVKDAVHHRIVVGIVVGGRSGQVRLIDLYRSIIALCKGRRGHETAERQTPGQGYRCACPACKSCNMHEFPRESPLVKDHPFGP
jgi:hypothetical protein